MSECKTYLTTVENDLLAAKDRFKVGEYTFADVDFVELELLETRFEGRDILFADCCAGALQKAASYADAVINEAMVGSRTVQEVTAAKKNLMKIQGLCR